MSNLDRRGFLGASLACLASAHVFGRDDKVPDDPAFQPNTLFLTWQRDPTTTMTVQWVGTRGETSDATIRYCPTATNSWTEIVPSEKPYPKSDFKVFRAELTGLTQGTKYQFRIGKSSPTYRFRTMPAKATDTIQFVSGGDCGVNPHAIANNIQAARQDPMFAIIGGDLGYDNGRSVEISLAFLRNYSKHMVGRDGCLIPMITCIGNHEVDGSYGKQREHAPFFYALFDGLFPETGYATLDFGDYLSLVLLDTGHTTPIGGEQASWLEKTLMARVDHPNVIAVNHVPAYPSYRSMEATAEKAGTGEENRKHWVPLFEKYRVPLVLEHHDHTFKRTKPLISGLTHNNGVLYLGDGSWGRLRTPRKADQMPHMAVTGKEYHLSCHRIQGDERFHVAMDETGRIMDTCRTGQRTAGLYRTN